MNVLLSIKPKYVEEMVRGRKRYEFRRCVFRREVKEAVFGGGLVSFLGFVSVSFSIISGGWRSGLPLGLIL